MASHMGWGPTSRENLVLDNKPVVFDPDLLTHLLELLVGMRQGADL